MEDPIIEKFRHLNQNYFEFRDNWMFAERNNNISKQKTNKWIESTNKNFNNRKIIKINEKTASISKTYNTS